MRTSPLVLTILAGTLLPACDRGAEPTAAKTAPAADTKSTPAAATKPTADSNACHLLTPEEVAALIGRKVTMVDQTEADDTSSTCEWEVDGQFAFGVTATWSGGKAQWEAWRTAQGLGDAALKRADGASASEVVEQGLVPGIGDAAYFSELLPSLVLVGDTLLELNLALVPGANTKFRGLALRLVAKLD